MNYGLEIRDEGLGIMDFGCLIVGQPFRVADDFAMLKHCPTKKSPSNSPFMKGGKKGDL